MYGHVTDGRARSVDPLKTRFIEGINPRKRKRTRMKLERGRGGKGRRRKRTRMRGRKRRMRKRRRRKRVEKMCERKKTSRPKVRDGQRYPCPALTFPLVSL